MTYPTDHDAHDEVGGPGDQYDAPAPPPGGTGGTRAEGLPDWDLLPPALVLRRSGEPE